MEIFILAGLLYLILAGFVASLASDHKRNPLVSFFIGVFTTPIGGWIYLKNGKKKGSKRVKNKGPWNEWMVKADRMVEDENWEAARGSYLKALGLLNDAQRSKIKYSPKYIQSKISEINYAVGIIDAKSSEGTKVVQLPKTHGESGIRKISND